MTKSTIQTVLNFYYFDTSDAAQSEAWMDLYNGTLLKLGVPAWPNAMGFMTTNPEAWKFADKMKHAVGFVYKGANLYSIPVELETENLFGDQWNSAPIGEHFPKGARLFNWVRNVYENKNIKTGYWLTQTEEMRAALVENVKCGYCGHMAPASAGHEFCTECLGSEHLTPEQIHLTRMVRVCDSFNAKRAPLTEAETAERMPKFRDAQIFGATERDKKRIAAERAAVASDYEKAIAKATVERDVKMWALDNGIRKGNMIFYPHRNRVTFGWRKPLSDIEVSTLLDIISEFPYPYELLCEDGRNLQGN